MLISLLSNCLTSKLSSLFWVSYSFLGNSIATCIPFSILLCRQFSVILNGMKVTSFHINIFFHHRLHKCLRLELTQKCIFLTWGCSLKLLHLFRFVFFFLLILACMPNQTDIPTCVRYAKMFGFCTSSVKSIRKYMFQNCAATCGFCRGKSLNIWQTQLLWVIMKPIQSWTTFLNNVINVAISLKFVYFSAS